MSAKRIITTHLLCTLVLGVMLGVTAFHDDNSNFVLAIPLSIAVLLIGYSGPLIAGVLVLALVRRRYPFLSFGVYLGAYYVLLTLLLVWLFASRHETDSGFAVLAVPYLPLPALIATLAINATQHLAMGEHPVTS